MPQQPLPTCACIGGFPPNIVQQWIYCALLQLISTSGGDTGSDQFSSNPQVVTVDGSIPSGVLGWSITALSGTVTVNGSALAVGASVGGGGYGGRTLATAISYTIAGGSAIVTIDTPV